MTEAKGATGATVAGDATATIGSHQLGGRCGGKGGHHRHGGQERRQQHGGHGGEYGRRRADADRGRFDSEGAAARARRETVEDRRGKFGWG